MDIYEWEKHRHEPVYVWFPKDPRWNDVLGAVSFDKGCSLHTVERWYAENLCTLLGGGLEILECDQRADKMRSREVPTKPETKGKRK